MSEQLQPETLELVGKIRVSLKVLHGQMREVERALASLPQAQERPTIACPDCGPIKEVTSLRKLMEHRENVHHDGVEVAPPPAHDPATAEIPF